MTPRRTWYALVLHWGSIDRTAACLASLNQLPFTRVLLLDNGTQEPQLSQLASGRPNLRLVRNPDNLGYAAGNNVGLRIAQDEGAELVAVFNNDVVVEYPSMLDDAQAAWSTCDALGVLWPEVHFCKEGWREQPVGSRMARTLLAESCRGEPECEAVNAPLVVQTDIFAGCSWLVRSATLARVGLLREDFFLYHEETDLAIRLRMAGLLCGRLGDGKGRVLHCGSTARGLSPSQAYYAARNAVLLLDCLPHARRPRATAAVSGYVVHLTIRCLGGGSLGSAVECWRGLAAGLRGERGKR